MKIIVNKLYMASIILFGVLLLKGCIGNNNQRRSTEEQAIISDDGLFSITIPRGWVQVTDYSLHDEAELQARKLFGNQYFVALMENKDDLDFTFDEWMTKVINDYLASFEDASISAGEDIIVEGHPAKQFEIKGITNRVRISLLATYIDGESYYSQILAWTLSSKYKSSVENLKAITNSIKGL